MRCGVVTARAAWRGRAISGGRACLPGIQSSSLRECAAGIVGKGTIGKLTTPRALTPDSRSTGSLVFSLTLPFFPFPSRSLSLSLSRPLSHSRLARSLSPSSALFSLAIRTAFSSVPRRPFYVPLATARPFVRPSDPFRSLPLSPSFPNYRRRQPYLPTPRGYESQIGRENERARGREQAVDYL